jgi:hypothetical protein
MDLEKERNEEMAFQNAKREMKAIYGHSDSKSSDNEHCKAPHVMFGRLLRNYVPGGSGSRSRTTSGWRHQLVFMPLIVLRAWLGMDSSR